MSFLQKFRRSTPAPEKSSAPGLIGIDIATDFIHLCQIRPLPHGLYSIRAKISIPYEGSRDELLAAPKLLKRLVNGALKRKRFQGRRVSALMPWEDVRIILLTYKASVSDVDAEVVKMLARRVEGPLEDYVVDYVPVRCKPSDEEHMVIATLAPRDQVDRLLGALMHCGLEVDSLDVAPTAVRRVVGALYTGHAADNVLLVHGYRDETYLTVISGRRLLFTQAVTFGENLLLERISGELDVSPEAALELVRHHGLQRRAMARAMGDDADGDYSATLLEIVKPCFLDLVNEINRVLVFTAAETHGVPVSRVCLLGNLAHWPGAQRLLITLLDIEQPEGQVEFNQVFRDENEATQLSWEGMFSDISVAMGLALRGLVADE